MVSSTTYYDTLVTILATLGALPPPTLLSSVALVAGGQTAPTVTTPTLQPPLGSVVGAAIPPAVVGGANPGSGLGASTPLVLSPAAEPFPSKLVDKVRSRQFVEMRELLADNIALLRQLEAVHGYSPLHALGSARPRLREVTSIPTWCYTFLGYMAILTTDPATRDQLAYARLVIREALRHGGSGWLDYDRAFRQQVAADPSLRWNTLLPGLQASTVLGQGPTHGTSFCTLCRGVDHTRTQCALFSITPPVTRNSSVPYASTSPTRRRQTNICLSWNSGGCFFPGCALGTCVLFAR